MKILIIHYLLNRGSRSEIKHLYHSIDKQSIVK